MTGFTLTAVPEIAAGAGRIASIGGDVARLAGERAPVLLVADPGLTELGITARVADGLAAAGHTIQRFENITSDALESEVSSGARLAREMGARMVVGVGGGSALDAAKMIAVLGSEEADVADYRLSAHALPERQLPLLCAPSTGGSGSEMTSTSVLSSPEGIKYWYWSPALKPDFVVLDAELTVSLPRGLTAATGLDALVHAIEAATNRNATPINTIYALEAVRLILANLPASVREPDDLAAREALLTAACLAGIAIDNAGTGLAHTIGHALAGLMPIQHGRAVAIGMAASLDWTMQDNEEAFVPVAELFGSGPDPYKLPGAFLDLMAALDFEASLPQAVDPGMLAGQMAAPENNATRSASARIVGDDDLLPIAERVAAFAGGCSEAA